MAAQLAAQTTARLAAARCATKYAAVRPATARGKGGGLKKQECCLIHTGESKKSQISEKAFHQKKTTASASPQVTQNGDGSIENDGKLFHRESQE
jgi:hypothetical protein